jgi:ferredoxin
MDLLHKKGRLAIVISMAAPQSQSQQSGEVAINPATCNRYGLCAQICPVDVLELKDDPIRVHSASF